ncbi:dynein regulatory complex subunit 4-like isoform X2 [Cebidichthys violaceus]|uniref:dynein regulatory complex subunit 4-like isoform X2 n=1 Tax=Cebidichthys violaceus TaxID=271503 RepID=UPI0035CBA3E9
MLEEQIIRLREELDRERQEKSSFRLQRDKTQERWEISKRRLEEEKAELRSRQRKRREAEDRHQAEMTVYKQKLKHVLSEHHNTVSGLKVDAVASTTPVQSQLTQSELGLQRELEGLQAEFREKKLHNENNIMGLKLKHRVELMELENNFAKRSREINLKYSMNMQSIAKAESQKQSALVKEISTRTKSRIVTLTKEHDEAVKSFAYLRSVATSQKSMKGKHAEAKKQEERLDKNILAAQQENKRLRESLQEGQEKLPELQKQLPNMSQVKVKNRSATEAAVKRRAEQLRDMSLGCLLQEQTIEKVQQERDEMSKKQTEAISDVQQKSGMKRLLLGRKVAALTDTLEKKEAQLCGVLSACNVDQTAGSKLQEILDSKQATINTLQSHLAQDCTEYDDLLKTCKEKMKDLGIPLFGFPFKPSKVILGGQTRVQNAPGPASKE